MEFSFGPDRWVPKELLAEKNEGDKIMNYALGLHAPGFFDKVLNVNRCLLQSEPANLVFPIFLPVFSWFFHFLLVEDW